MVEVDLLALLERDLLHAAVVGIQGHDRGPGESQSKLPGQFRFFLKQDGPATPIIWALILCTFL